MEPQPPRAAFFGWSRSRPNLFGAGADPICSEPESAPGPWTSAAGAAQKGGGSATLEKTVEIFAMSHFILKL